MFRLASEKIDYKQGIRLKNPVPKSTAVLLDLNTVFGNNLKTWLTAEAVTLSGGNITQFNDLSASANHAVVNSTMYATRSGTLNGYNTALFNNNARYNLSNITFTAYTLGAICKFITASSPDDYLIGHSANSVGIGFDGADSQGLRILGGGDYANTVIYSTVKNNFKLLLVTSNGSSTTTVHWNGLTSQTINNYYSANTVFNILGGGAFANRWFNGYLAELFFVNRLLTGQEVTDLTNNFVAKYALS